jgi:hypothetical protein
MQSDTKHNGHAADTTSNPVTPLSETEYLTCEANAAREAISDTLAQMRQSLKDSADVRAWARQYPWATLGAAAAAGFLAATAVIPKRRESEKEHEPMLMERILADEQIAARIKELAEEDENRPKRPGVVSSLAMTLLRTFGPAVQSAIASALAAKAAAPDPDDLAEAAREGAQEGDLS